MVFQACLGSIDAFASGGGLIDMVSNQVGRVFMVGFLLQVKSDERGLMLSVHFLFDVRGLRGMERGLVCACRNVPIEVRDERKR